MSRRWLGWLFFFLSFAAAREAAAADEFKVNPAGTVDLTSRVGVATSALRTIVRNSAGGNGLVYSVTPQATPGCTGVTAAFTSLSPPPFDVDVTPPQIRVT